MVDLKKDISLKGLKRKADEAPTQLPVKDAINLAQTTSGAENQRLMIIAFAAAVIIIAILCKFFVIDVLASAITSGGQVSEMENQIARLKEANESYAEVNEEYAHYVVSGLTEEELALVNRDDVVALISKYLLKVGTLQSINLTGNVITANVGNVNMAEVSNQVSKIQADDLVQHVTVSTASGQTNSSSKDTVATIIVTLAGGEVTTTEADDDPSHDTVYEALTGDDLDD